MKLNQEGAVDFLFVSTLVVLVAAAAFTVWRIQAADETVSETDANVSNQSTAVNNFSDQAGEAADNDKTPESNIPQGWVEYRNEAIGIAFAYPEEWGEVEDLLIEEIAEEFGDGKQYSSGFSDNDYVQFSGATEDFNVGRGGNYFTGRNKGWDKDGADYKLVSNYAPSDPESYYGLVFQDPNLVEGKNASAIYTEDLDPLTGFTGTIAEYVASYTVENSEYAGFAAVFVVSAGDQSDVSDKVAEYREFLKFIEVL